MTVTGAAMLWVGWFGFNGGSALGANGDAASALVVTQISASVTTLVWMAIEWMKHGKPACSEPLPEPLQDWRPSPRPQAPLGLWGHW